MNDDTIRRTIPLFPRVTSLDWEVGARLGDLEIALCPNPCPEVVPEWEEPGYFLTVENTNAKKNGGGMALPEERCFLLFPEADGSLSGTVAGFHAVVVPIGEWPNSSHSLVLFEERQREDAVRLDWKTLQWRLENEPGGEV